LPPQTDEKASAAPPQNGAQASEDVMYDDADPADGLPDASTRYATKPVGKSWTELVKPSSRLGAP